MFGNIVVMEIKNIIKKSVAAALMEDHVRNDVTSRVLISRSRMSTAEIIVKEPAVVCGVDFAREVFRQISSTLECRFFFNDGDVIKKNTRLAEISGSTRSILAGERVALNYLGYLSGISTKTRHFVDKVKLFQTKILATRKTTPGNRMIEKYAVVMGGGYPHRSHLADMGLVKDNHRVAFSQVMSLAEAVKVFKKNMSLPIEVEVDTIEEFQQALDAGPDMILLDNMCLADMRKAVNAVRRITVGTKPLLEASGGITLENVRDVARTGVDRISVGSLTHSRHFIDVSMEFTS
jgi:nicotinate-nucleotide pyrophosphorylase (carboxylating)